MRNSVTMGMMQSLNASAQRSLRAEQLQSQVRLSKQELARDLRNTTPKSGIVEMTLARAALRKWVYNVSGFNRYGLHHNDCLDEWANPDVEEAVRRLPPKLRDERNFRIFRAMHLSMCKIVLPECEWIKYEEDDRYLQPYIDEVVREREEREEWNKTH